MKPQNKDLVRCVNPETQKVKFLLKKIAENKQLMKSMGFVVADAESTIKSK